MEKKMENEMETMEFALLKLKLHPLLLTLIGKRSLHQIKTTFCNSLQLRITCFPCSSARHRCAFPSTSRTSGEGLESGSCV